MLRSSTSPSEVAPGLPPARRHGAARTTPWLFALLVLLLTLPGPGASSRVWAADDVQPALSPAPAAAAEITSLETGGRLFEAHCAGCHVGGGNIIRRGRTLKLPALQRANLADPQAIARIASSGIGQMSGYGSVLGEEGARQVGAWVWLQAQAGWPQPPRREPLP